MAAEEQVVKGLGAAVATDQGNGPVPQETAASARQTPGAVTAGISSSSVGSSDDHGDLGSLEAITATVMAKFNEMCKSDEDKSLKTTIATEEKLMNKAFAKFIPLLALMTSMIMKQGRKDITTDLKEDMKDNMRDVFAETKDPFKDEIKGELKGEMKEEFKEDVKEIKVNLTEEIKSDLQTDLVEIKQKFTQEINSTIGQSIEENVTLQKKITEKIVKCKVDVDRREAFERSSNIIFSGLPEEQNEKTNRGVTTQIVMRELEKIRCNINKDDLLCQRIFKRNAARSGPSLILARFASPIVKNKVMSFKQTFNDAATGKFMNEDMTALQRSLFHYLRNKEDIVIKKTVGYRDGKITFLLKRNESSTATNKWSYAHNILDLVKIDDDLKIDLMNAEAMKSLGLHDCMWATGSD